MKPTPEQKLAIEIRDANVLVSAAAGSGKTSVLVKRVTDRVLDSENPVDIDRLLIMTFTNAAAAEMQGRIREAIEEHLRILRREPDPDDDMLKRLEKQSILVHNAMITTIHGFCKSVITDHFDRIGLDPDFRVADENECRLIRREAIAECLEEAYEEGNRGFLKAVECFAGSKDDEGLENLINSIYDFIMANPDPERFAKECTASYGYDNVDDFASSPLMTEFKNHAISELYRMKKGLSQAIELIDDHAELSVYRDCIEAYSDTVDLAIGKAKQPENFYDELRNTLNASSFPAFGRVNGKNLDEETAQAKKTVTFYRDIAKKGIASLCDMMLFDLKTTFENTAAAAQELNALTDTVLEMARIYSRKKLEKNVIDFNDMEHMAVSILSDPSIADIYRQYYEEIYVDEYQDSNMTQEKLIGLICRHDKGNVFQVGDVKQSIYSFRQARPGLFLSKYETYGDNDRLNRRILLNDNFRSRREVVDSVNEVFAGIMKAELGGIDYDDSAKLNYAATYYDECTCEKVEADDHTTELILGDPEDISTEEFAANVTANRINQMIADGYMVYDKGKKIMRPVTFGDFTILVRSVKKYEPVFRKVFEGAKIPLAVSGSEGYFGTLEIQTALSFLSAVDNPLNDIPLAALMRSPVGGFSDKDLAGLTAGSGNDIPLYDRVVKAAADDNKCAVFLDLLREYSEMARYTPVHDLLSDFVDRRYGYYVRSMSRSRQRMANLEMLLAKAEEYERTSFSGLYQFMNYIDQIRKYDMDEGEAGTQSENDDVVRLMTIHGSKGLEFPVCFLVGIEKRRNTSDERGKVIWNERLGFGTGFTDLEKRLSATTLPKEMVSTENRRGGIAEEMRVLYVAMTRAREKLIMIGCDKADGFESCLGTIEDCDSYLDMLKTAHGSRGFDHIVIKYTDEKEIVRERLDKEIRSRSVAEEMLELVMKAGEKPAEPVTVPSYLSNLPFIYPYPIDPQKKAKLSVSELKHRAIEEKLADGEILSLDDTPLFNETNPEKYIPRFAREEGETATGGTFYGTAFHRILELWDYPESVNMDENDKNNICYITPDTITGFANEMRDLHRMDKDMVNAIRPEEVAAFLNSPLGARMRMAKIRGELFREQPFVIGIEEDGETILVQGIIDAYFIENGHITVVDYKTDRVDDAGMLINRYKTQLEYYGTALERITHLPVVELIIYSTRLKQEINIG